MDIKNLFIAGGVVMWPLLLSSVLAVGLIVERIKFWVTISSRQQRVVRNVLNLYRQDNVVSTIDTLRKNANLTNCTDFFDGFRVRRTKSRRISLGVGE